MTANAPALFDRRFWLWLGAGVGLVVLAVVVVVMRARAKSKGNPPTTNPPAPAPPGTATPPYLPVSDPGMVISPAPNPAPVVQQINYEYVRDLTWKMDATVNGQGDHACEITNGVLEMGGQDLAAFAALYLTWYGRVLKDDYCTRVQSSGCWSSWWDGKHTQACARLQTT